MSNVFAIIVNYNGGPWLANCLESLRRSEHPVRIVVVEGFHRVIFKGHLTSIFPEGAFGRHLSHRGILLKAAGKFFERETDTIKQIGRAHV